jgi:hypothetical protein
MTIAVRQEWPSAWTAASATTVASGNASSSCLAGSTIGVWVVWSGAQASLPSGVVDSASQTYTYTSITGYNNNTGLNVALYKLENNTSATQLAITATWAAAKTFRGIWPFEISGSATTAYQTAASNSQDSPGATTGALTSGNVTPTSQPCLLHGFALNSSGNAVNVVAGSLSAGTTGLLLSGNSFASGASGSQRLTSTSAIPATFTNTTDGGSHSFLTSASVWTELSSNIAVLTANSLRRRRLSA